MQKSKFDAATVIDAGHPPVAEGVILIDWDGVVQPFGQLINQSPPNEGVVDTFKALKEAGYTIVIFTSRLSEAWHESEGWDHGKAIYEQVKYMLDYMKKWDMPFDKITAEKVPALAYFDDKAFRVNTGDWGLYRAVEESGLLG